MHRPGARTRRRRDLRLPLRLRGVRPAEEVLVRQREVGEVEAAEDLPVVPLPAAGEEAAVPGGGGRGRQVEVRDGAGGRALQEIPSMS